MTRDLNLYLQDILESIKLIEKYVEGVSKEKFLDKNEDNIQMKDAIVRRLEIIGEAVKNIPDDFREQYSEMPWKKIAGMRDFLIHEYFGILMERVWNTAKNDLPILEKQILEMLKENK